MQDEIKKRIALIGKRLKQAREAMGYTQESVAEALEIGRPRYSDIENGKRDVPLKDLYRFCSFFGRPLEYFIRKDLNIESGFKVLFRKTEGDEEMAKVITEFENMCEKMRQLEKIVGIKIKSHIPDDYDYENKKLRLWGHKYANDERQRLGLGQAPLSNLDQILEEKCGLKIFYLPIPPERSIWGMFTYDEMLGGCILINTNPAHGRQLFSLAHEYAHYVFHKKRLGIVSYEKEKETEYEKLADYFASGFLMPENSVKDIFNIRVKKRDSITAEDVIYIADYFGVSFQAMVYRLNNLGLINNQKKEELINETWVTAVRASMGLTEPERGRSKFPSLYFHLCIKAYQQGRITTAKLADFLELPLYQAMELGRKIKRSNQDDVSDYI